jgi:hypothetical protein
LKPNTLAERPQCGPYKTRAGRTEGSAPHVRCSRSLPVRELGLIDGSQPTQFVS